MSDPASYRPAAGSVPAGPGVYRFRDADGRVLYVGKAKSLRARLASYFQDPGALHPRTRGMVLAASRVEWTVVATEVEALQLEYNQIKEFTPRFNVRYRDDKSYPSLAVTLDEEFPRVMVVRERRRVGVRYFGPYAHAWAIRETVDQLLRVFPVRSCSPGVFTRAHQVGRPCLFGYIGKCSAPCVGRVSAAEHRRIALDFCDFLAGGTPELLRRLETEMLAAAGELDFERAARLRDDRAALERVLEKQAVVLAGGTDCDVIAIAEDALEAAVQVFYVRGGRVRGQRGWVVDKVEELDPAALVEQFLTQAYGADGPAAAAAIPPAPAEVPGRPGPDAPRGRLAQPSAAAVDIPPEILVPALPADPSAVQAWLAAQRGAPVALRVARRGEKRALALTVQRNAEEAFALHKLRRAGDLTARSRSLQEIQDALDLAAAPLRIECFDVSHVQGRDVVASMVVFEDALPRKAEYRRFALRGVDGGDDTAWMREVVGRRFAHLTADRAATSGAAGAGRGAADEGAPARRFAYPPQLVVVDGGPAQVAAATAALAELGIDDVAVCGLAKRLEEVWLPAAPEPVILPRSSEGLYLLQRIRDEAHRFAITYHRQRRSKSMLASELDGVPGLGEVRRLALLRHFGSLRKLRAATVEEVMAVPGLGRATAEAVVAALAGSPPPVPAADPLTGEVLRR